MYNDRNIKDFTQKFWSELRVKDISALLSSKELAACPSLTFKVQVNWNLLVEIIAHRAHSGLIEIAEMGSTKGSLVTEGKFNEKPSKFDKNAIY